MSSSGGTRKRTDFLLRLRRGLALPSPLVVPLVAPLVLQLVMPFVVPLLTPLPFSTPEEDKAELYARSGEAADDMVGVD